MRYQLAGAVAIIYGSPDRREHSGCNPDAAVELENRPWC